MIMKKQWIIVFHIKALNIVLVDLCFSFYMFHIRELSMVLVFVWL